ncbi:MAG: STAS domain-containing protein [Candidatus Omnitrophica bacterium]|nr:STAS domain-containing protein [Candidatus Omnitrophota bacterium]
MPNKPEYLDKIDELEKVSIVRLKGNIDQQMIPVIQERILANRKKGSKIDKNVLVDYALVEKVDSAAVAFHLIRLKEYEVKGFKIGFMNASDELLAYLNMFRLSAAFKIYSNEKQALAELNK